MKRRHLYGLLALVAFASVFTFSYEVHKGDADVGNPKYVPFRIAMNDIMLILGPRVRDNELSIEGLRQVLLDSPQEWMRGDSLPMRVFQFNPNVAEWSDEDAIVAVVVHRVLEGRVIMTVATGDGGARTTDELETPPWVDRNLVYSGE